MKLSGILFLTIISFQLFSQQPPTCGTDLMHSRALQDPAIQQKHTLLEQAIYQQMNQRQGVAFRQAGGSYVLPVVVHVIHNNGAENISDAQVFDAIDHINDAFANVGYYDSLNGVNTNIQFCLAKQTPQGAVTNGIVRVQSSLTDLDMADDVQMKNLSRWNPLCYANIWIVKEICSQSSGCGVAGYAYFPSSHGGSVDGLVVEARYFGSSPGNTGVAVHELGHYLGLYHTFQGGCTNNNCLNDGDKVCDTPPDQSTAAIACGGSANTCSTDAQSGFTSDQPDNHTNYMDYGFPACMNMYTQGQTDRMQWHIENVRSSLLNCISCNNPCTTNITAQFAASSTSTTIGSAVTFTNQSVNAATYNWLINGQSFSSGISPSYNFTQQGTYIIRLVATGSDPNCVAYFNDTITVTCGVVASMTQSTTAVNVGGQITFTNTSIGGTSFNWYVDGVLVSNSSTTYTHTFNASGTYPIYLIANGAICSDTTSIVNFIQVGQPCAVSFTYSPQQPTTCLPITFTPDTNCRYTNYSWTFCEQANLGIPTVQSYPVVGPLPAGAELIKDHNGNYHAFYSAYSTTSSFVNTVYRLDFGNSVNNTPVVHPIYTPSITATYAHGIDVVYDGGNYYGFAIYYNSIYRFDFGTTVANDTPSVTQVTGFTAGNINWASKIEAVRETNTWWLLVVARNGGFNVLYLGNDVTNNVQNAYQTQCTNCWGFSYHKVNGNHYAYVTNVNNGMKLLSFGNSLANTPVSGAFAAYGTGYHGDVSLYQNCDGSFDGVILKENQSAHTIIHLDSINATPQVITNSFSNGLPRTGTAGKIIRTDGGLTMFTSVSYSGAMAKLTFPDCGITYSNLKFPAPVYYPQAGNYYVKLAADEGLPSQQSYCMNLNVTAISPTPLDLGPNIVTCANAAIPLDAGAGYKTYLWDDGTSDQIRTTFFPGTYWVEATDSCNNNYRDTITITVDSATDIVLNDATICRTTGVILTAPTGFSNYVWTPATGLSCSNCSTTVATPTDTTVYTVTATTLNGCVNSASATINVNDCGTNLPLTALLSSVNVSCTGGNEGSVSVFVSGGTPPYSYLWSTGHTITTVNNLSTGSYSVTVSDSTGTTIISNVFINAPAPLIVVTASYTQRVTCFGDNSGAAKVFGSGGTPAYTYLWNNGHTGDSPTNLPAGTHTVTVTDANGCTASSIITILEGAVLDAGDIAGLDTVDTNIPATFTVNAGYNYTWQSSGAIIGGQATSIATIDWNNTEGFDTIQVIVSLLGCADTLYKPVVLLNLTSVDEIALSNIELFPNPNNGLVTVKSGYANAETTLRLFDTVGKLLLQKTVSATEIQSGIELDLSLVSEGIYFLHLKTGNATRVMKVVRY